MTYSKIDIARLAAYIDGEGSIGIYRKASKQNASVNRYSINLCVFNTDPRLILWLRDTFGGTIGQAETSNRRWMCFRWRVVSKLATKLLRKAMPYFVIKAGEAKAAILLQSLLTGNRWHSAVSSQDEQARDVLFKVIRRERNRYKIPVPEPASNGKESGYAVQ